TARFLAGDLVGAMDDCQRALELEPDHFGSLAGYGHIYFRLDDMDMAILYWRRALAVNPNLDSVAPSIDAAERILRGRGRLQTCRLPAGPRATIARGAPPAQPGPQGER